jgi:hypothetical protein
MTISADRLDAAMLATDSGLARSRERDAALPEKIRADGWLNETLRRENAARVTVRRVVAALNGIDIAAFTASWTEPPAMLTRETADLLKSAMLNGEVFAAVEKEIGSDAAATLLGEIASL